jgi:restriction system protein
MAIPDFQSIMLPLLRFLSDGEGRSSQEIFDVLERQFNLTEEEKNQFLPSGKQKIIINRIGWAKSFLKQAGLIASGMGGRYNITNEGREILSEEHPGGIDVNYLRKLPTFNMYKNGRMKSEQKNSEIIQKFEDNILEKTPEEYIEYGFNSILQKLKQGVGENIKKCSFYFFEKLVVDLLLAMGYGGSRKEAGKLTRKGSDEGIDGVINEDKLGLDMIYIQAKRWEGNISRPEIQKFAGALQGKRAKKGIYITTSAFTKEAFEYSKSIDSKIVLIDGERLAELMIEHNVGVTVVEGFQLKKVNVDYFIDD